MAIVADELILVVSSNVTGAVAGLSTVQGKIAQVQSSALGLSAIGGALTKGVTLPILGLGAMSAKAAIDFESAFAGVRKTVDATEAEFAELEQGIRDMAKRIPASTDEIAAVAEAAGQLGIETENILEFTETMLALGVATNLTSEEAATAMARIANVMQTPQTEFDRFGSTIVALGNNMATTEAEIVEMSSRLAAAGAQVGLSEADVLSFSAALSSIGIRAEAGGTAFSQAFARMANSVAEGDDALKTFADTAGMSVEEFKTAFETDAAGAMVSFIEGLGQIKDEGGNVYATLEDLGFTGIRLQQSILGAAGAGDLFRDALELGSEAWEENNALTKEAEQRYATTESQLEMMRNKFKDIGITIGNALLPMINEFLDLLGPLIEQAGDWIAKNDELVLKIAGFAAAIGPAFLVFKGLATVIGAVTSPIGLVVAAIIGLIAIADELGINFEELGTKAQEIFGSWEEIWDNVLAWAGELWEGLQGVWEEITGVFSRHRDSVGGIFSSIQSFISSVWTSISDFVKPMVADISSFVSDRFGRLIAWFDEQFPKMAETVQVVLGFIQKLWEAVWPIIAAVLEGAWNNMKAIVDFAMSLIMGFIETGMAIITGDWDAFWSAIQDILVAVWTFVGDFITSSFEGIVNFLSTTMESIIEFFGSGWDKVGGIFEKVWNGIVSFVSSSVNNVLGFIEGLVNGAIGLINDLINVVNKIPGIDISPVGEVRLQRDHFEAAMAEANSLANGAQTGRRPRGRSAGSGNTYNTTVNVTTNASAADIATQTAWAVHGSGGP